MSTKVYIVTETDRKTNVLLRYWVCLTEEQAKKCLKKRYDIACSYNRIAGVDAPTDCMDCGFFFWDLSDGQALEYHIKAARTFEE